MREIDVPTGTSLVLEAIDAAIAYSCREWQSLIHEYLIASLDPQRQPFLESPIEAVFEVWWHALQRLESQDSTIQRLLLVRQCDVVMACGTKYRADFAIQHYRSTQWRLGLEEPCSCLRLLIELDGHDWHERTPEQVAQRNQRDRLLLLNGYRVLHYSGRELLREPPDCVAEVMAAAAVDLEDRRPCPLVER